MDAKVNYTVVGTIGILLIACFVGILIWLSRANTGVKFTTYVSYFNTNVSGLNQNSSVKLNGIKVGFVKAIKQVPDNLKQVKITLQIKSTTQVTTQTYAELTSTGLTGAAYIAIVAQKASAPALKPKAGQKYAVIPTKKAFLATVEGELKGTVSKVDILVSRVNDLLDISNRKAISQSLENVNKITGSIAAKTKQIEASLNSMQVIMDNTAKASKEFPKMIETTEGALESFKTLSTEFTKVGRKATGTLEIANNAIQNVTIQLVPSASQLLQQLNTMMSSMSQLGSELARNPSILIRGKTPPTPGPGEK